LTSQSYNQNVILQEKKLLVIDVGFVICLIVNLVKLKYTLGRLVTQGKDWSLKMTNFRKLKEHAETAELRDAIVELVIDMCQDDSRLDFNKVDRAFCLAWEAIEDYNEPDWID
jgi:hypothetical protein